MSIKETTAGTEIDFLKVTKGAIIPGGGGGGASAFTDLTDAPATIVANSVVAGNAAGDAVEFVPNLTLDTSWNGLIFSATNPDPEDNGANLLVQSSDGLFACGLAVSSDNSVIEMDAGAGLQTKIYMKSDASFEIDMNSPGAVLALSGFDVVASDATAHMTVSGVEYSIAKAIKVKIGTDTYFWPLFGPV